MKKMSKLGLGIFLCGAVLTSLPLHANEDAASSETSVNPLIFSPMDPNIPLNFNKMAGVAKNSPSLLSKEFSIDKEGNVHL